ncbi:hypothetical protein C8Q78DRAFT_992607 [Trametes maxima]|nr:hypothetical protein C8Q78DRAFT_992607 [Trametes maxima]
MVGTSYDLPPTVRSTIPQDLPNEQLRRCPVRLNSQDQHVFFWPEGLFPHHLRPVAVSEDVEAQDEWIDVAPIGSRVQRMGFVPAVGNYCRLVFPNQRRFMARVSRVVEYQETRIILWVEHTYSPVGITVAVPYPFYEGTRWWYLRLMQFLGRLRPDENRHSAGKSIHLCTEVPVSVLGWVDRMRTFGTLDTFHDSSVTRLFSELWLWTRAQNPIKAAYGAVQGCVWGYTRLHMGLYKAAHRAMQSCTEAVKKTEQARVAQKIESSGREEERRRNSKTTTASLASKLASGIAKQLVQFSSSATSSTSLKFCQSQLALPQLSEHSRGNSVSVYIALSGRREASGLFWESLKEVSRSEEPREKRLDLIGTVATYFIHNNLIT